MTAFENAANRSVRAFGLGCLAAGALFGLACGDMLDDNAMAVVQEKGAIIGGTVAANDVVGTPIIDVSDPLLNGRCTGTMIRKDWVLTANHCVTENEVPVGGTAIAAAHLQAKIKDGPNTPKGARIVLHPALDVALVKLDAAPLGPAGSTFSNPLYAGSVPTLVGQPLFTQGWGMTAITNCEPPEGPTSGLTFATLPLTEIVDRYVYKVLPSAGQILFRGDSGSSQFATVNGYLRPMSLGNVAYCHQQPLEVYESQYVRSDGFRGWLQGVVGTGPPGGPISGFERMDQATSIIYTTISGKVRSVSIDGPGGPDWTLGTLSVNAPLAKVNSDVPSLVRADGASAVYWATTSNQIIELHEDAVGWHPTNLMVDANAPAMAIGGHFNAYVRTEAATVVVYPSSDGHIRELSLLPDATHWGVADITPAGSPGGARPVGYVRGDTVNAVVYVDGIGHLQELTPGGVRWDLTSYTGAPAAVQGVTVYSRSDGYSIVLFRDANQDIWELAMSPSGSWSKANLTVHAGCQKAFNDPYGYVRADGVNAVVYKGTDGHAREMALESNWVCNDLTGPIGAPNVGGIAPPYGFVAADLTTHVVYRSSDSHIRDLKRVGSSWVHTDLTMIAGGP